MYGIYLFTYTYKLETQSIDVGLGRWEPILEN